MHLLLVLLLVLVTFLLTKVLRRVSQTGTPAPTASPAVAEKERPFGTWEPVAFTYPPIPERVGFSVDTTPAVSYRPFRYGKYPINMGIRPMAWEDWIQLDSEYRRVLAVRKERSLQSRILVNKTQPGFRKEALEVLCEIAAFLAERHPTLFRTARCEFVEADELTWGESIQGKRAGAIRKVSNLVTGEVFDFEALERSEGAEWDPMRVAGLLVQDDLAVMVENTDGEYVLQAGSICTAGSWRLVDKIGTTLDSIHTTGGVVGWKEKLKPSMERYFRKLKEDKPVERNNYFFQTSGDLAWNQSTGPEDAFDESLHGASPALLPSSSQPDWTPPAPVSSTDDIWFRTERQTLRRLPATGCILFTIRTYLVPVREIARERGAPGRMASALRSWPENVASYKGAERYIEALLPMLDEAHRKQVAMGLITLDSEGEVVGGPAYPY